MKITIHNAMKKIFEGEAREIILPGEDGEFSVMDFHQYCLYRLRAGQIKLTLRNPSDGAPRQARGSALSSSKDGGTEKRFPIKRGLVNIAPDKVAVMVED